MTLGNCTCAHEYGGTTWPAQKMEPWFLDITHKVAAVCGIERPPNSCNLNFYRDGTQHVGWHSDNEPLFGNLEHGSLIISLPRGACSAFA